MDAMVLSVFAKTVGIVAALVLIVGFTGCDFDFGSCSGSATRIESQLWVYDGGKEEVHVLIDNWKGGPIVGISPDEQRLFSEPRGMLVWNLSDGSSSVLGLEASDERVDLAPDGSRIALQRVSPSSQIWLSDAAGMQIDVLLPDSFSSTFDPKWLGDSRRLAFVGYRQNPNNGRIYVFNVEDSALSTLSEESVSEYDVTPDGSALVYVTAGFGERLMRFKRAESEELVDLGKGFFPRITPSGDRIVYAYEHYNALLSIRTDGTDQIDLVQDWIDTRTVELSPSGTSVSVATETGLWLVAVTDGSRQQILEAAPLELVDDPWDGARVSFLTPTFSADGSRIYFVVERELYNDGCPDD